MVAISWAYAASRIHSDYEGTLEGERNRLRDVTAALQSGTLAMLHDGVGAAVAGTNEFLDGYLRGESQEAGTLHALSAREREIVQLLAEGSSNKDVARTLKISTGKTLINRYAAGDAYVSSDPIHSLSNRELQILLMIAKGGQHPGGRGGAALEHQDGRVASPAHQAKTEPKLGRATGAVCDARPIQVTSVDACIGGVSGLGPQTQAS